MLNIPSAFLSRNSHLKYLIHVDLVGVELDKIIVHTL